MVKIIQPSSYNQPSYILGDGLGDFTITILILSLHFHDDSSIGYYDRQAAYNDIHSTTMRV